ncbi:MAG: hypothetical protein LPK03_02905 [Pontibacter sp.]|nr:hypothetical protein [Pontibacter sp.]
MPDETARTIVYDYLDPKPATWPEADFIVGNPPFIGPAKMREALGDGYTEALRKVYKGAVPESADFVMFWWHKAAEIVRAGKAERFGFITTNSIKQTFNRRVIEAQMQANPPLSITLAIPDHPWVDSADGAAVDIAMTVGKKEELTGRLLSVVSEVKTDGLEVEVSFAEKQGRIQADLSIGAEVASVKALKSNSNLSNRGFCLFGSGFIITPEKALELGLGSVPETDKIISEYRNGKDLVATPRGVKVIDLFGYTSNEVRLKFPNVYQHVLENVKPERDQNKRASRRENWWIFGEPNPKLRDMLKGLDSYIATVETAKHRVFTKLDKVIKPDNKLLVIALQNDFHLGVLSSKIHTTWSLAAGSTLEDRPVYVKTTCFETFPFPDATEAQKEQIRSIAEQLDAHRKQRQAQHPTLTITDMYNVLEKLKAGEPLNAKEQKTHEQGLVSILLQLHQELDAAVAAAYGWPANLPEEEILERLVALNKARAAEEARGHIRWLRPEYQNPQGTQQGDLGIETKKRLVGTGRDLSAKEQLSWPKTLAEQAQAVQRALQQHERP